MNIVLVAAIGEQRQLGLNNELLWQLPGDLPRFKEMTMGAPIVMGRKTFDSIGRPLPGRTNIVLTRNAELSIEGVVMASSVEKALDIAKKEQAENVFIIGGGEIYQLFLEQANVLELTLVEDSPEADAFFPEYLVACSQLSDAVQESSLAKKTPLTEKHFKEISRLTNQAGDLRYHYVRYERSTTQSQHSSSS